MTHWHVYAKYNDPTTASMSGMSTLWHKEVAQEEALGLNATRIGLGYNDFVWAVEECGSLECLIDALAR